MDRRRININEMEMATDPNHELKNNDTPANGNKRIKRNLSKVLAAARVGSEKIIFRALAEKAKNNASVDPWTSAISAVNWGSPTSPLISIRAVIENELSKKAREYK